LVGLGPRNWITTATTAAARANTFTLGRGITGAISQARWAGMGMGRAASRG
jgi:hypothetical protein